MKCKQGFGSIILLAGLVLISAQQASADVTVVYKINTANGNGQQTIHYADKQHVRIDMQDVGDRKISMMKLNDKVYVITGKVVQDLSQLAGMMAMMGKGKKPSPAPQTSIKFVDTGKTETIAGIRGKVFSFVEKGRSHEVVLAKNKDLHNVVLALVEITKAATTMMPVDASSQIQQNAALKNMAMLRVDNTVRLQSMTSSPIAKRVFTLPSRPQQMPGMDGLMGAFGR